ncbi:MAG: M15 family metallopeptidase [Acidaminococcaceae bacterium]|nr:M15 family metallopeptidase [Acidaminococcaceae bacterium]MDD4722224.1 M15 family metallopeptidase [Acidaminococcaceae bacterium]
MLKKILSLATFIIVLGMPLVAGAFDVKPDPLQKAEDALIGLYTGNNSIFLVREAGGKLSVAYRYLQTDEDFSHSNIYPLTKEHYDSYTINEVGPLTSAESSLKFERDKNGNGVSIRIGQYNYTRKFTRGEDGKPFRINVEQPWETLQKEAQAAKLPKQTAINKATLVDLALVIPDLHYDLRYTTKNNIFGVPLVKSKKAYLDQEAAEALARVQKRLKEYGYGLIIWEAYRSWSDFKLATLALPQKYKKILPTAEEGYPHNTGRSVDVSLYDLSNGEPVRMISDFDELTPAQYSGFIGGNELQRWQRDLLREMMGLEGFVGSDMEWWHFDYIPDTKYQLLNIEPDTLQ